MNEKIKSKIDCIEGELKRIGYWSYEPPNFDYTKISSYLDCPTFDGWLQFVFIPNAKMAVEAGAYPDESMVGVAAMRQYNYHSIVEEALPLTAMLHEFDQLINGLSSSKESNR